MTPTTLLAIVLGVSAASLAVAWALARWVLRKDDGTPEMREAHCPYCEREVLVYETPPRCPLCACPLEEDRMHPYVWPDEEPSPSG